MQHILRYEIIESDLFDLFMIIIIFIVSLYSWLETLKEYGII
jgi:hypothetical protein